MCRVVVRSRLGCFASGIEAADASKNRQQESPGSVRSAWCQQVAVLGYIPYSSLSVLVAPFSC